MLGEVGEEPLPHRRVGEVESAPVGDVDAEPCSARVREVLEPGFELLGEHLLRAFVLDQEHGDGLGDLEAEVVDAGRQVEREVEEERRLALAAAGAVQGEAVAGDQWAVVLVEQERGDVWPFERDELVNRERERPIRLVRLQRTDKIGELFACSLPVAPVGALGGWSQPDRARPDDPGRLLGAFVARLVGVVAEIDAGSARDPLRPFRFEGERAGGEHEHGRPRR